MAGNLARHYTIPPDRNRTRALVLGLIGAMAPVGLGALTSSSLLRFIPGANLVGMAVTSIAAAACTRSIGLIFIEHFESGGTLLDFEIGAYKESIAARAGETKPSGRGTALTPAGARLHGTAPCRARGRNPCATLRSTAFWLRVGSLGVRYLKILILFGACAGPAFGASQQDRTDCKSGNDIEKVVAACTRILDDSNTSSRDRYAALEGRGLALLAVAPCLTIETPSKGRSMVSRT
jgi:hypothetical protein